MDSRASHYIKNNIQNLSLHSYYDGTEEIVVDNGKTLPITHTGSVNFSNFLKSFVLTNVLIGIKNFYFYAIFYV